MNQINKDNWREFLIFDELGERLKRNSIQNVMLVMRFDTKSFGHFKKDDKVIIVEGGMWNQRPEPRTMTEGDIIAIMGHLEYCGLKAGRVSVKRAIDFITEQGDNNEG